MGSKKRDQRKREHARRTRRPAVVRTGTIVESGHLGDSVFFPMVPKPEIGNISDGKIPPGQALFELATGKAARPMGASPREIRALAKKRSAAYTTGILIPTSHFREPIQRLIAQRRITPSNVPATIEGIKLLTSQLLPHHTDVISKTYKDLTLAHGEFLSPLIAIQEGGGQCDDRAAVFAAMARVAGLRVGIAGHPEFNRRLFGIASEKRGGGFHIWPMVAMPSGEMAPVHLPGSLRFDDMPHMTELAHRLVEEGVTSGKFPMYGEYVPSKPIVVPKKLRVKPDVFRE